MQPSPGIWLPVIRRDRDSIDQTETDAAFPNCACHTKEGFSRQSGAARQVLVMSSEVGTSLNISELFQVEK
jgi:hypothetical protein